MKRTLRNALIAIPAVAAIALSLHWSNRSTAQANANINQAVPPLVVLTDSLRTVSVAMDEKLAELHGEEIALRERIAMPVVSDELQRESRALVADNGNEFAVRRGDAFELTDRIHRQEQYMRTLSTVIAERRDMLNALPRLTPCDGNLTSNFGMRIHPISGEEKMHTGMDIAAPSGQPIRAAGDAVVKFSGTRNGYGNMVELDHGFGYHTLYGHASRLLVKNGDTVRRGQVIALVGATGAATGPHLHYEVIVDDTKVNPVPFLLQDPIAEPRPAPKAAAKATKAAAKNGTVGKPAATRGAIAGKKSSAKDGGKKRCCGGKSCKPGRAAKRGHR